MLLQLVHEQLKESWLKFLEVKLYLNDGDHDDEETVKGQMSRFQAQLQRMANSKATFRLLLTADGDCWEYVGEE